MKVVIDGKEVNISSTKWISKGLEADIYDIGNGKALKLYKQPNHVDLENFPLDQKAAKQRIAEHQNKLPAFPHGLPEKVIMPESLARDKNSQKIVGYSMRFLSGAKELFYYQEPDVDNNLVREIFCDLHATVSKVHSAKVVIGDFNDLNILVIGNEAYLIDADSFQFGKFLCKTFTDRFVDPCLVREKTKEEKLQSSGTGNIILIHPHNIDSDWYAYTAMLWQSLLFVNPYGGVYKPKDLKKRIPYGDRMLARITVLDSEVVYPKKAIPYKALPDDLLHYFHLAFEKDKRGEFPLTLIQKLRWTKCMVCNTDHARAICPQCSHIAPEAVKEVTTIRGQVMATRIFKTSGAILFATIYDGQLKWLYHESGQFKREDGATVIAGKRDSEMRFRLHGGSTLMAKGGQLAVLSAGSAPELIFVDQFVNRLPVFDANENNLYWLQNGQLRRDGPLGPVHIGDVLSGQTLFWVGPTFGFGFYRAGNLNVAFVFDAKNRGINDSVKLPTIRGQLIDSTCSFAKDYCWFFYSTRENGKSKNQCVVIGRNGSIEATAEAEQGDGSWLGEIRGKCAIGGALFSATDEGVVRVEFDSSQIVKTREFPDTEQFVRSDSHLFPATQGLYTVGRKEIYLLKLV